jgi:hypothetical protein
MNNACLFVFRYNEPMVSYVANVLHKYGYNILLSYTICKSWLPLPRLVLMIAMVLVVYICCSVCTPTFSALFSLATPRALEVTIKITAAICPLLERGHRSLATTNNTCVGSRRLLVPRQGQAAHQGCR